MRPHNRQASRPTRHLRDALLLVLMVPALIIGPALASGVMLMHSHGDEGLHGHVMTADVAAGVHGGHSDHAWHAHEHAGHALDTHAAHVDEHGHDLLHDSLHGHVPPGTLTELPTAVWPRTASSRTTVALELARLLSLQLAGDVLVVLQHTTGPQLDELRWAPHGLHPVHAPHGSGAARVLRLSHALLI